MSMFNQDGLRALKVKADSFRDREGINMKVIPTFYRNKPSYYFKEIEEKYDNVMHPYLKDDNGDEYCPLNKRVRGLFYNGRRDKTSPSELSRYFLFGNKRVIVPAKLILNSQSRLYFCDFWCHRKEHYVTIAVTKMGTEADVFCQKYLLEIEKSCNKYIELDGRTVSINQNIWVEVFSTEKLDLKAEGLEWDSGSCPRQSRPDGMRKKSGCSTCNLPFNSSYVTIGPSKTTQEMSINRVPVLPEFMTKVPQNDTQVKLVNTVSLSCLFGSDNGAQTSQMNDNGDRSSPDTDTNPLLDKDNVSDKELSLNAPLLTPVGASNILKGRKPSEDESSSEESEPATKKTKLD